MDYWRQLDILSPDDIGTKEITVIGAGGIGSPTLLALNKMGFSNITVYDFDNIEPHNLPNQFFRIEDINKPKVDAIHDIVNSYTGHKLNKMNEKYENQELKGIVISGVDSMEARDKIWERVKFNANIPYYIDARMGAETARVYAINPCVPSSIMWYEQYFYTDGEALELPCTSKSIIYCTLMIAAIICNQVKKFVKQEDLYREIIFDFKTMIFITNK